MGERIFSVTEVNTYVQKSLQADPLLHEIAIRGEVSNARRYTSGHWYFTLKDESSALRCVWFFNSQSGSSVILKEGMNLVVRGSAGLYLRDGAYQLTVSSVSLDGTGAWYERFEKLKAYGIAKGWFDEARKRPLPLVPTTIGIVTSADGAALRDIIRVSRRRMPGVNILLYPVLVQGAFAEEQIAEGIRTLGESGECDVIITGRGGGSIEDLWAFNEVRVLEAIARCPVPVISAVGHQTDTTLSDYAADVRAATPSMAAELATPERSELKKRLDSLAYSMNTEIKHRLLNEKNRLMEIQQRLDAASPVARLRTDRLRLEQMKTQLTSLMQRKIEAKKSDLDRICALLNAMNPTSVTSRGYALVRDGSGMLIKDADSVIPGSKVKIYLSRGRLDATVDKVVREDENERV